MQHTGADPFHLQKQAQQQQQQVENFKKAFSVCLEAKDYMVRY